MDDRLLAGFEAKALEFPDDYDGRVVATLVRLPAGAAPRGAVLYVHGFVDYFFQRHMAERFAAEGYAFSPSTCESTGARFCRISIPISARTSRSTSPTSAVQSKRSAHRCCSPGIPRAG